MTVCIAGVAENKKTIVCAFDQMLGAGVVTVDLPTVVKAGRFGKRWYSLYAGNDVSKALSIIRRASQLMRDADDPEAVSEVADIFVQAFQEERIRLAEQTVLSKFRLTMQDFMALLASDDNESLRDMKREVEQLQLSVAFLIVGFDGRNTPHLFTVTEPGVDDHYDTLGFWSIGTGSDVALNSLFLRKFNMDMPLRASAYCIAEAKFNSESAIGVGKSTVLFVLREDGSSVTLLNELNAFRGMWEQNQNPLPANLETLDQYLIFEESPK